MFYQSWTILSTFNCVIIQNNRSSIRYKKLIKKLITYYHLLQSTGSLINF